MFEFSRPIQLFLFFVLSALSTMSKLREENVQGYDAFQKSMESLRGDGYQKIWVFFCGALKPSGESWNEDCTKAVPVIDSGLHQLRGKLQVSNPMKAAYIFVSIERKDWKGNNQFRQDKKLKLTALPAVIYWEGNLEKTRLNEKECSIPEKVYSVFTV